MRLVALLIALSFASKQNANVAESDGNCGERLSENGEKIILVKIEEDEFAATNVTKTYVSASKIFAE